MCWGSPYFMATYWAQQDLSKIKIQDFYELSYQSETSETIKNEIKKLHKYINNAVVDDKDIIVGNGATQIISGLINILGEKVYAEAPHYSRFPIITNINGKQFVKNTENPSLQIITCPNNPDSKTKFTKIDGVSNRLFDLSYNWPQYTTPRLFNEDIMVFSLSKCTGHASSRIGWGVFKDKKLAKEVEKYVEYSTSGVSLDGQLNLLKILKHQENSNYFCFEYGKRVLFYRWKLVQQMKLPFKVLNSSGMFMWCEGERPKKFSYIDGSEFGSNNKFFRLNLGCHEKVFTEFYNEYN